MINTKYTPAPWTLHGTTIEAGNHVIAQANWFGVMEGKPDNEANAVRIVACVNACEGISPEAVPEMLELIKEFKSYHHALYQAAYGKAVPSNNLMLKHINEVLAKAEGE